ncbi:MAG: S41 family peptidase [Acidobacteriaceae bacterium]
MNRKAKAIVLGTSLILVLFIVLGGLGVSAAPSAGNDGAYRQIGVYSEVLSRIRSDYVEEPNFAEVKSGALHGLLESLDPESSYMSPQEYTEFKSHKAGANGHIGVTVSKRLGYAAVVSVLPGSPAEKAGIEVGDIIEALEGKTSRDLSVAEVRSMLAGDPGSSINLVLVKPRKTGPQKVTVQRAVLVVPKTNQKMLNDGIGYIQPYTLTSGKSQEIAAAIKGLEAQGAKKIVLDLRNNGQGDPQEGVSTANLFLNHGLIGYVQGQKYPKQEFTANPAKTITSLPVVVLVNTGTAGAAEIVSAALLENARADLVGSKTFGVGSIQKTIEMPDGAALLLSVAKYYTPGGKAIQDTAITPNVLVTNDLELAALEGNDNNPEDAAPEAAPMPKQDQQLQRAIEILKNHKA